jgi:hypothetical protein
MIPRWGHARREKDTFITQDHHYRVNTFLCAIDAITSEMDQCFNEVTSELLLCYSRLDPRTHSLSLVCMNLTDSSRSMTKFSLMLIMLP